MVEEEGHETASGARLEVSVLRGRATPGDAAIERFLDACPESFAQQTVGWRNVIAPIGPDDPFFQVCRRAGEICGVLPAYAFEGPLGRILTSVPQAGPLGGVACAGGADDEAVYAALIEAYLALARDSGAALASLITNPFRPDRAIYDRHFRPGYALENVTQALDLQNDVDENGEPRRASENVRRNLRRAGAVALRVDDDQNPESVAAWYEIHAERHRAIGATPLPKALFTGALAEMVPRDKARFFFVRRATGKGEMIAGGFYVYHGEVIDALMPAMRMEAASLAPNYHLAAHTIRWAKRRGLRYYNWEPSPPTGGVARFKRQWGSTEVSYYYLTRVTGDASAILAATPEEVSRHYPWHYVVPFDRLGPAASGESTASTREAAWSARHGHGR